MLGIFLGPLGLIANTVQLFTYDASQTHKTIHILKADGIYYPLMDKDKDRDDKDKDKDKYNDKDKNKN